MQRKSIDLHLEYAQHTADKIDRLGLFMPLQSAQRRYEEHDERRGIGTPPVNMAGLEAEV